MQAVLSTSTTASFTCEKPAHKPASRHKVAKPAHTLTRQQSFATDQQPHLPFGELLVSLKHTCQDRTSAAQQVAARLGPY